MMHSPDEPPCTPPQGGIFIGKAAMRLWKDLSPQEKEEITAAIVQRWERRVAVTIPWHFGKTRTLRTTKKSIMNEIRRMYGVKITHGRVCEIINARFERPEQAPPRFL